RLLSLLPPVVFNHIGGHLAQSVTLGCRKIGFLVFGEDREHKHWQSRSAEQINNSRTTALTSRAKAKPHLANAAATGNDRAACGVSRQTVHNGYALVRRKQALRVSEIKGVSTTVCI